jgi:glycolate oxidase
MLDTIALRALETAVGKANVCDDPTVTASYSWNTGGGGGLPSERLAPIRPAAIAMPGSTEEVQAVVRACLDHGLHFRAHSTGNVTFGLVTQKDTVSVDLRRMDRIIEIDVDNQMAIIEPYVTAGHLIVEGLKHGLISHVVGAGWTHSPLASATSLMGIGIAGNHTGQNNRNLLAYEWVTPEAQIVRGGAAGCGAGWFAGEGPGPGFRGMIRGSVGATGALGIFTKIGYKLHPWNGKRGLEHTGRHPNWGMALSETERVYHCVWQSWDDHVAATYELLATKAATFIIRIPADQYGWTLALSNRDYYDMRRTGTLPEIAREENRISWSLMAVSGSSAEAAWRDRTIRAIVEQTGGRILTLDPHHEAMIARNITTSCYVPRAQRGGITGTITSYGIADSFGLLPKAVDRASRLMAPYKKKGGPFTEGDPEQFWIWPSEGRNVWAENIVPVDSVDVDAMAAGLVYVVQTFEANDADPTGHSSFATGREPAEMYGPQLGHINEWMRKIKQTFDPAWAADGDYIRPKPAGFTRFWPYARHFFIRWPGLLRYLLVKGMKKGK